MSEGVFDDRLVLEGVSADGVDIDAASDGDVAGVFIEGILTNLGDRIVFARDSDISRYIHRDGR